ncbi:speriolin-like [Lineus longissimus]|uniref:speriolin-like n=1 Tax=Lineus longissimus TaxID=88925 RepID=UPI00315C581E
METFLEAPLEPPEKSCGPYSSPCDPVSSRHAAKKNAMGKYPSRDVIQRLVGEIAFQLDRRILNYIFNGSHMERPERKRFYGFTIGNIPEMIDMESRDPTSGMTISKIKAAMAYRHKYVFHLLHPHGYRAEDHAMFAVRIVNKYGLLNGPLEKTLKVKLLTDAEWIRTIIKKTISKNELKSINVFLDCLVFMANDDGKPLFIW